MKKVLLLIALTLMFTGLAPVTADSGKLPDDVIVLTSDNTLVLADEVSGESVAPVILKARELDKDSLFSGSKKPVYLFLNTPGGSIQTGLEFIEALKGSKRPVHTVTLFSASMGFQIAQSLGDRLILDNGTLMSHRAAGQIGGSFGGQKPSQLDSRYGFYLSLIEKMDQQTVKRTKGKQTLQSYQAAYANELWIDGSRAVEQGYADRVVKMRCDDTLTGVDTHKVNFLGLTIVYDLDKCPINTSPMNIRVELPVVSKDRSDNKAAPSPSPSSTPSASPSTTTVAKTMDMNEFISRNGGFGPACLYGNVNTLCAADPNLTLKDLQSASLTFVDTVVNKKDHVVRMKF